MKAIILSAGKASRLAHLAPRGCKVLVDIGGETVLDRQLRLLPTTEVTVVCRSPHLELLAPYPVDVIAHDRLDGPVNALRAAQPQGDTIVVYGDTLWSRLPDAPEWIGMAQAAPGRAWDGLHEGPEGPITYSCASAPVEACVGLYRFAHAERIPKCESMPPALARYGPLPRLPVEGWADAGTIDAVAAL